MISEETLCIHCRLAVRKRCSWSRDFEPVDGWTAEETKNGYRVIECPLFSEGRGLPREMDTEGMILLLRACARQMRDDYIHGNDLNSPEMRGKRNTMYRGLSAESKLKLAAENRAGNRRSIENWIRGEGGRLLNLSDPEGVIDGLRKLARMYENELARIRR